MPEASAVHQGRLLFIDDAPILESPLLRRLERAGYAVRVATDGDRGLDATRDQRPDLVFCDWALRTSGGLDYCRRVKADPELRATYVTLLSARGDVEDRVRGLDAGADDYLVKPIRSEELLARVRTGLRARQLQRQLLQAERYTALLEMADSLGQEINDPLTALFGHIELMLQSLERGDQKRLVHHIRGAGDMAARIAGVGRKLDGLRVSAAGAWPGGSRRLDLGKR